MVLYYLALPLPVFSKYFGKQSIDAIVDINSNGLSLYEMYPYNCASVKM
jgi:hypothetical protein